MFKKPRRNRLSVGAVVGEVGATEVRLAKGAVVWFENWRPEISGPALTAVAAATQAAKEMRYCMS
jgi:hypothetical protein